MSSYKNKVVWITGASSGIGEALVKVFAEQGANVVLSARNSAELERVRKQNGLNEENSMLIAFDLADTTQSSVYVNDIIKKFGSIHVLINNGGFSQRATAAETDLSVSRNLMEVNFFAPVVLTKAVLPHMMKMKEGHIVVISSIAGKFGFYLRSSYSAAKHALHGYFESFRMETEKSGIKTLIVCPGKINTPISLKATGADGKAHNKMDPSHEQAMSAEDCARGILAGMLHNKEEIFVGGKELKAVWMKRHFPKWFSKLIRKQSPY